MVRLATLARDNKLTIEQMTGGTFTLTNGGIFGSMLSTPIINAPQSAILGMHNIIQRPVAENGQVVIRPMMYLALSYDHRIIDGRESVRSCLSYSVTANLLTACRSTPPPSPPRWGGGHIVWSDKRRKL